MKNKKIINIISGLFIILLSGLFIAFITFRGSNDSNFESTLLTLFIIGYPVFTLITSIILQLLIKKKVIILSIILLAYLILNFSYLGYFRPSYLIFCVIYTSIGLVGTFVADLILRCRKNTIS